MMIKISTLLAEILLKWAFYKVEPLITSSQIQRIVGKEDTLRTAKKQHRFIIIFFFLVCYCC